VAESNIKRVSFSDAALLRNSHSGGPKAVHGRASWTSAIDEIRPDFGPRCAPWLPPRPGAVSTCQTARRGGGGKLPRAMSALSVDDSRISCLGGVRRPRGSFTPFAWLEGGLQLARSQGSAALAALSGKPPTRLPRTKWPKANRFERFFEAVRQCAGRLRFPSGKNERSRRECGSVNP